MQFNDRKMGDKVLVRLAGVLTLLMFFFVLSFINITQNQERVAQYTSMLTAANMQKIWTLNYAQKISGLLAAHRTSDWVAILELKEDSTNTGSKIDKNYEGFLKTGLLYRSNNDSSDFRVDLKNIPDSRALAESAEASWFKVRELANVIISSDVEYLMAGSHFSDLAYLTDQTVALQNQLADFFSAKITTQQYRMERQQLYIVVISFVLFMFGLIFSKFRIAEPLNAAAVKLQEYVSVIENSSEAVIITSSKLSEDGPVISYVNDTFLKICNIERKDCLNQPLALIHKEAPEFGVEALRAAFETQDVYRGEIYVQSGQEPGKWLSFSTFPIFHRDNGVNNFAIFERDISASKAETEKLKHYSKRLHSQRSE